MKKMLVTILTVVLLYNAILPSSFYEVKADIDDNKIFTQTKPIDESTINRSR